VIATLSDETLAAIRARLNAATPGPYRLETDSCDCGGDYNCGHGEHPYALRMPIHNINYADTPCDQAEPIDRHRHLASDISELTMETAEFIAAARDDVAALLAEVDRLRAADHQARLAAGGDDVTSTDSSDRPGGRGPLIPDISTQVKGPRTQELTAESDVLRQLQLKLVKRDLRHAADHHARLAAGTEEG
jgi:hypothetical protein